MKRFLTLRGVIIFLTGILFAVYSVYNIYIIINDSDEIGTGGTLISAAVALIYAIFAFFAFSAGATVNDIRFYIGRRILFILALVAAFGIKLRLIRSIITAITFSDMSTVLYGASFILTQFGMLFLIIYYVFIARTMEKNAVPPVTLQILALVFFALSLICEMVLLFVYGIGLEGNPLQTMIFRPVFYLGFIGLSVYFMLPPPQPNKE